MNIVNKFVVLVVFYNLVFIECACPDVQSVSNFDLAKLAGTWYDVAVSSNNEEYGAVFANVTYEIYGDKIKFITENVTKDDPNFQEGYGKRLSNGKILCSFTFGSANQFVESLLSVLTINEYFVSIYGCVYDKNSDEYQETVWVSSKMAKLEGENKATIQNYLDSFESPTSVEKVSWKTNF